MCRRPPGVPLPGPHNPFDRPLAVRLALFVDDLHQFDAADGLDGGCADCCKLVGTDRTGDLAISPNWSHIAKN